MASHQLAIAKASLAAGLLRPDPTSVARDDIASFHTLLEETLSRCSPSNVQKCKQWLVRNIAVSSARVSAVGKYLVALSASLSNPSSEHSSTPAGLPAKETSGSRKCLHILYILHDVLHHTKYHGAPSAIHTSVSSNFQPHLVKLVESAASSEPNKHKRLRKRLLELLDLWQDCGFYAQNFVDKLKETVDNAGNINEGDTQAGTGEASEEAPARSLKSMRNAPYVMPAFHGDPSTPYYDLPAGNMLPYIVPNSSTPISTQLMKPLQFMAGPADQSLVIAVKDFLKDVDAIYDGTRADEGIVADIDEMGQPLVKDEVTGDLEVLENYYGWSKGFCERMKKSRTGGRDSISRGRSQSRSISRSRSRSYSPRKRRRDSSTSRRSSISRSRSGARDHRRRRYSDRRSLSDSRSPTPPSRRFNREPSPKMASQVPQALNGNHGLPQPPSGIHGMPSFPIGPNGLPIPPPPPPMYSGPWPPPPPPSGATGQFQPFGGPGLAPQLPQAMGMPFPPQMPPQRGGFGGRGGNPTWNQRGGYGRGGWRG